MFKLWLRRQPDASYEQLIKALHEVGDETVANSLRKKDGKYYILYNHFQVWMKEQGHDSITLNTV